MASASWAIIEDKINEGYIYYDLHDNTGTNLLSFNDSEATPSEISSSLKNYLDNLTGGKVRITLSKVSKADKQAGGDLKTGDKKNIVLYYDLVNQRRNNSQAISGTNDNLLNAGNNSLFLLLIDTIKQNADLKSELKLEEMRAEIRDLKNRDNASVSGTSDYSEIISLGKEIIAAIRGGNPVSNNFKPVGNTHTEPRQPENSNIKISKDELSIIANEVMVKMKSFDPDYVVNMQYVAEYARQNPDDYRTLVNQIKNSANGGK